MKKRHISVFLLFALLPIWADAAETASVNGSTASHACTRSERWTFTDTIRPEQRERFSAFLSGKSSPVRGFAQALALRRSGAAGEQRLFSEYWISRALFDAGMQHIAYQGFSMIAGTTTDAVSEGVRLAALQCLNQIQRHYTTVPFPPAVAAQLPEHLRLAVKKEPVWQALSTLARTQIADHGAESELRKTLELLNGSGVHETFVSGIWSARHGLHQETVSMLEKFLLMTQTNRNDHYSSTHQDQARLLLARAYYSMHKFAQSAAQLKLVRKSSNDLAKALSEQAWATLLEELYSDAIGAAMSLQAGGMRHTFAPEAPMVMAMALNELCQYPESLKAVNIFRREYEKPYRWLSQWNTSGRPLLYPEVIRFLKKQGDVPRRVASEWVRSPYFISHQEEINLLFEEKQAAVALGRDGSREQKAIAREIREFARELKPRLKSARAKAKPGGDLPVSVRSDLGKLRGMLADYLDFRTAAPVWRAVLKNHQKQAPGIEKRLIARINDDLKDRTSRMLVQLEEIAENNQLIEVEIYNGASQDIIWQNAHPDYKEVAKKMNQERPGAAADQVWNWGRFPASEGEDGEIWEDELGSFKANLFDNCSSKDKYLAIKRRPS